MRRRGIVFTVLGFVGLCLAADALAAGNAEKCLFTIQKVMLKNTAGDWVVIAEPNQEIDLASEQLAEVISIQNKGQIPPASYENFKIRFSEKIRFAGLDGANLTQEGGEIVLGGNAAKAADIPSIEFSSINVKSPAWNTKTQGLMTEILNFDFEDRDDYMEIYGRTNFQKPLVVKANSTVQILISVDVKEKVRYVSANYYSGFSHPAFMYFLPPEGIAEINVKSDATTVFMTAENIEWAF